METKTCCDCKEIKNVSLFSPVKAQGKIYYTKYCKLCRNIRHKKVRALLNPDLYVDNKLVAGSKYQVLTNKDGQIFKSCRTCNKELSIKNFSIKKDVKSGYSSYCNDCETLKHTISLSDSYIKNVLVSHSKELSRKDVTQELIDMKRKELTLKRKIKSLI